MELENDTATLNRLDEVLRALGDETEAGLVCIELHDAAEGLLDDHVVLAVDVVGIIEEHPGGRTGNGAALAHEFRETLADGGDAALIGGAEAEGHRGLLARSGNTLGGQLFGYPGIGQHCLTDTGGTPQNQMGWRCQTTTEEGDGVGLPQNGVHCRTGGRESLSGCRVIGGR